MRKVFITGASGLLGSKIMAIAREDYEVLGQYNKVEFTMKGCQNVQLDLCDREKLFKTVGQFEPDFLIHTAAIRDMDYCEAHKEEALAANVEATRNISDICTEIGTKVIFISTDVIFDGTETEYKETSEPKPLNYYAETKVEGESIILQNSANLIARISFLYGWNVSDRRLNFVTWVLNNLKLGNEIDLYMDHYRNGTFMDDAARLLLMMYMRGLSGIYHLAGKYCMNRFEMGELVCEVFGYDKEHLVAKSLEEASWIAKRPTRVCMDVSKAEEDLGLNLLSFRESLLDMKKQESQGVVF
ncbi:MAG: SDR family oxidoreductase [Thermoplasmata archaeon]|nr:MAG: SDR family oxidoreductase [Thermoplasmata archaeon]